MENKIYCIFCGQQNSAADEFCHQCGAKLDPKDEQLQEYLLEKIKGKAADELKGKATDAFLDWLKNFLNSKMYGILLSLTVLVSAGGILLGGTDTSYIQKVDSNIFLQTEAQSESQSTTESIPVESGQSVDFDLGPEDISYSVFSAGSVGLVADLDDAGSLQGLYLLTSKVSFYDETTVVVRDSAGSVALQVTNQVGDTMTSDNILINKIEDIGSTVEATSTEDPTKKYVFGIHPNGALKLYEEYENDVLMYRKEFYDDNNLKYSYTNYGQYQVYDPDRTVNMTEEVFYDPVTDASDETTGTEYFMNLSTSPYVSRQCSKYSTRITWYDDEEYYKNSIHLADGVEYIKVWYEGVLTQSNEYSLDKLHSKAEFINDAGDMEGILHEMYPSGQYKKQIQYVNSPDNPRDVYEWYENGQIRESLHYEEDGRLRFGDRYAEDGTWLESYNAYTGEWNKV